MLLSNLGNTQLTAPIADSWIAQSTGWTTGESWFDSWQGKEICLFSKILRLGSVVHPTPNSVGAGEKWPGCGADQSPPSSTKIKNKGIYMSALYIYLHGVHTDKFMLTFCCPWYQMGHLVMR